MKKLLLTVAAAFIAIISGCANFSLPDSSPAKPQTQTNFNHSKLYRGPSRRSIQNSSVDSSIAINNFNNLSLDNVQNSSDTQNSDGSNNLWTKVAAGLKIPNAENRPEVQEQIRWFMTHPSYLQRTTERARPYLYIVYQEVQSRNLPTELVLLPINESAYYPFSYSSAGATGIWQLMPGTASDFGLKRTFWYDGRRDIFDSTNAALDYLTYLANYFNGDWLLAIAAYDTGEGNVQNAIARNLREGLPTDFWSLRLASETRSYVPRLLALAAIIAHPDRYPVSLPPVEDKAVVGSVHIDKQIKLTDAAKLAGISVNQLKVLNPGLSRTATDPRADSKLLLPLDSINNFKTNLSNFNPPATQSYGHYRVQRGDTLQSIANRFGVSVDDLRQANNIYTRHVPRGKVLLIPNMAENFKPNTQINLDQTPLSLSGNDSANQTSPAAAPVPTTNNDSQAQMDNTQTPPAAKHVIKHKITQGETLSSISQHYHVSVAQLQQLNPGISQHPLRLGQVIIISTSNQALKVSHRTRKLRTN